MSYFIERVRGLKRLLVSYVRIRAYNAANFRVLSRCACMGNDVLKELCWEKAALNHQKSRVDFLLKLSDGQKIKPKPYLVAAYLARNDILSLIYQERQAFWSYRRPHFVVMDSYSELTDQSFVHRTGWQFMANYTDIDHRGPFKEEFDVRGLLGLERLEVVYNEFFLKLKEVYGEVPVIFLHFPTTLDPREKFKERGKLILKIMNDLASTYPKIYSLSVPDDIVLSSLEDNPEQESSRFPYHFGKEVFRYFCDEIRSLGIGTPKAV